MRRLIEFPCAGDTLVGTLDEGESSTGLLIVSGGNEVRMGAHRGMASLAGRLAASGTPVFRYDRRGVGDSTGENRGFLESAPDIAAAAATFAAETGVQRLFALGNCDAAAALLLFHEAAGIDGLIVTNPWVVEDTDDLPPAAAIRARYVERLADPRQWLRVVRGGVDLVKLAKGLAKIASRPPGDAGGLATRTINAVNDAKIPVTILLAKRDNTALAFRRAWDAAPKTVTRAMLEECETDSHSFAAPADKEWLFTRVQAAMARAT